MFIININQMDEKNLYRCDVHKARQLQKEGFSLLSIDGEDYIFFMTEALYEFLKPEGGENCE